MTFQETITKLQNGYTCMLPNYKGYFKYDYFINQPFFQNEDYITYDLDNVKNRTDFYYII